MTARWQRGCLAVLLAGCLTLGAAGLAATIGVKTNRLRIAPPAILLDLGPIWIGDFCRDNVARHRYPPGWCPRDYTLYVIFRFGARGSMHQVLTIPDAPPLPRRR